MPRPAGGRRSAVCAASGQPLDLTRLFSRCARPAAAGIVRGAIANAAPAGNCPCRGSCPSRDRDRIQRRRVIHRATLQRPCWSNGNRGAVFQDMRDRVCHDIQDRGGVPNAASWPFGWTLGMLRPPLAEFSLHALSGGHNDRRHRQLA
jgi:hypothetical protein